MIKLIKRSGLLIRREYASRPFYEMVKKELTRQSKGYQSSEIYFYQFYEESEKFLLIPRLFPIHQYVPNPIIDDKQHEGEHIEINHNIAPRSSAQERAMKYMLSRNNGILQLAPGVGKTVISIFMIAERKRKSMILVHRDSLADQWKDRFVQFSSIKEDQISRLNSRTVPKDLDKPIIIATVQTVLSLLKRNKKEFLLELDKAKVGVLVADEVHTTVGAPTFAECSIHIPAKYTYGLSATPYRYDGNGDIIEYHLGKIFSDDDVEGTMDANVTVILSDYEIDTMKRKRYIYWGGKFQRSRYLNLIKNSEPFIRLAKGILSKLNDRHIIFMSERKKVIDILYEWLPDSEKARFYGSSGLDKLEPRVTFTTPAKCRDGVDAPQKDCVIMTSPISNIEQLAGRVLRKKEGKKKPIIIDMVDYGCRDISRTFYKRLEYYDTKGWNVNFILQKGDMVKPIDRVESINIIEGR
jgi:superfamily II DNA or RNA helicase